jgi:hypothetical protein
MPQPSAGQTGHGYHAPRGEADQQPDRDEEQHDRHVRGDVPAQPGPGRAAEGVPLGLRPEALTAGPEPGGRQVGRDRCELLLRTGGPDGTHSGVDLVQADQPLRDGIGDDRGDPLALVVADASGGDGAGRHRDLRERPSTVD